VRLIFLVEATCHGHHPGEHPEVEVLPDQVAQGREFPTSTTTVVGEVASAMVVAMKRLSPFFGKN
jgi:hypothetical protein